MAAKVITISAPQTNSLKMSMIFSLLLLFMLKHFSVLSVDYAQ